MDVIKRMIIVARSSSDRNKDSFLVKSLIVRIQEKQQDQSDPQTVYFLDAERPRTRLMFLLVPQSRS